MICALAEGTGRLAAGAVPLLPPLPDDVAARILLLVPVPNRLRCREINRAWRVALAQPRFWRVLDLSAAANADSGYIWPLKGDGEMDFCPQKKRLRADLLRAASKAARGGVEVIDLSDTNFQPDQFVPPVAGMWVDETNQLHDVVSQNAAALRCLRLGSSSFADRIEPRLGCAGAAAIFALAPGLTELAVGLSVDGKGVGHFAELLSGPRGPALRPRSVRFHFVNGWYRGDAPDWTAGGQQAVAAGGGGGPDLPPPRQIETVQVMMGDSTINVDDDNDAPGLAAPALDFAVAWAASVVQIDAPRNA